MKIVAVDPGFRDPVDQYIREEWAGPMVISRGILTDSRTMQGFAAQEDGRLLGALLYQVRDGDLEISILFSLEENRGVAGRLIEAAREKAREHRCGRVWLTTTNDNTHAIRYYQKRGFSLKAVHINAIEEARKQKPQMGLLGHDDIPILHEVEFEIQP